ncbi:MAG: hypothetical protein ACK5JT_03785 [Hyphomicrobiaceae bacterium]
MTIRGLQRAWLGMAAIPGAVVGMSINASAQEYCVACTSPDAIYRCVLDVSKPPGMPLKLLCITQMAKEGGHKTCAIRGGTVFDCKGLIRHVRPPDAEPSQQGASPQGAVVSPSGAASATSASPEAAIPPRAGVTTGPPVHQPLTVQGSVPQGGDPSAKTPPARAGQAKPAKQDTVEDLAKEAGRSTSKTLKDAGKTITNSTQKAWKCVTSLFTSC